MPDVRGYSLMQVAPLNKYPGSNKMSTSLIGKLCDEKR